MCKAFFSVLPRAACVLVILSMVQIAEVTSEKQIIFPEIAAISAGLLAAPVMPWNTSKPRVFAGVVLCALVGSAIVHFVPLPVFLQISAAYALAQLVYLYSGTTFAPMISAMMLPVLLQDASNVYLLSAAGFTLAVVLFELVFEKTGVKARKEFVKEELPDCGCLLAFFKRTAAASAVMTFFLAFGFKYALAPPLLVVFTELSRKDSPAGKRPVKAVMLTAACAAGGALCRLLLNMQLGIPTSLAAAAACVFFIAVMEASGMFFPPAAALSILPFLISQSEVTAYPFQIFVGAVVWVALAREKSFGFEF